MSEKDLPLCPADYAVHDVAYQRKRAAGFAGWSDADELAEQIKLLDGLFSHSAIPVAGRALDLGCGAGNISFWLESRGYSVTGIDVSRVAIDWAIEQGRLSDSIVNFAVANAAQDNLDFEDKFDLVLDNYCLHCIIGRDRDRYLSNIFHNLLPGGIYICNTMCAELRDPDELSFFDAKSRTYMRNGIALRYIGRHEDIINEIKAVGFEILQMELFTDEIQDSMSIIAQRH
ncbi:MAG: class I SAM-dependent methyltransferase [Candidatus Cloacimonetes bacterium]|nr:class I SAM-dependent methyltransferase [Candidatus Cloacimonadota bacterium]